MAEFVFDSERSEPNVIALKQYVYLPLMPTLFCVETVLEFVKRIPESCSVNVGHMVPASIRPENKFSHYLWASKR